MNKMKRGQAKYFASALQIVLTLVSSSTYADRYGIDERLRDDQSGSGEFVVWFYLASMAIAVLAKVTKHSEFGWKWLPVAALLTMMVITMVFQFVLISPLIVLAWFIWFRKK